jgi:hypothetical protein
MVAALVLAWRFSSRRAWLFGFRRPAARAVWLPLGGVAALAALPARGWFPQELPLAPASLALGAGAVALAAIAVELWFRGVVHGLLLFDARLQSPDGPWRPSAATWVSALLYAAATLLLSLLPIELAPSPLFGWRIEVALVGGAALVGGLALGVLRERSLSLWPGVVAQFAGGLGNLVFWS